MRGQGLGFKSKKKKKKNFIHIYIFKLFYSRILTQIIFLKNSHINIVSIHCLESFSFVLIFNSYGKGTCTPN